MNEFLNLVAPGLVTGAIYSIMACGLVLTYQTSGMFNFGHSAVAFTTAYVYYQLHTGLGLPIVIAFPLAVLVYAPLLGMGLDRIVMRKLRTAPVHVRIVATVGLLVGLPNLLQWLVEVVMVRWWGLGLADVGTLSSNGNLVPVGVGPNPPKVVRLGFIGLKQVALTSDQVAVFVAAAIAAALLYWVLRRTRLGLEMRALVDRDSLAGLRGIDPNRTSAAAWVISMVLAGLGGVLIAPLFALNSTPFEFVVLGSLAAVVVAGFRSLPVAFIAGLGLGVVQNLMAGYSSDWLPSSLSQLTGLSTALPFVIALVLLLLWRGGRGRAAGSVAEERPSADHREGLPAWRKRLPWVLVGAVIVLLSTGWLPFFQANDYVVNTYIAPGMVYAIIYLSFVVVTGVGGMISLAQASFVTAGGLMTGWMLQRQLGLHIPILGSSGGYPSFWTACIAGTLVAALLGAAVAAAVRHLGALALALGTLALAFVLDFLIFQLPAVSNQSAGGWTVGGPQINVFGHVIRFDVTGSDGRNLVILLLGFFALITLLIHNLERSATGRAIFAVRSSEVAARTSGIAVWKSQVALFALSAGIAGFGGAWLGVTTFVMTPDAAPPVVGLSWLAVTVLMGIRRPGGALLAGLFTTVGVWLFNLLGGHVGATGKDLLTSPYFMQMLIGLGAVQLAANPDGVLALMGHSRLRLKRQHDRAAHIKAAEHALGADLVQQHVVSRERVLEFAGSATAQPVLVLEDVVAGYGEVEVLHGLNFAVGAGEIVALLGPNGAGKSTLCQVAAGALASTSGRVYLNGVDVSHLAAPKRSREGLLLIPEARGVFPGMSVEDNVQILLRSREARDAVYERFPILAERRRQTAGVLSGGEQQLLSLAPVLQDPPAILIADEPTLGLSPQVAATVLEALTAIRDAGTAVLLIEERASEVMKVADRVGVMSLGRLTWMGSPAEAIGDLLATAYLS